MTIEIVLTGTLIDPYGYRELAEEMCSVAATEPGTLRYKWQTSTDRAFRNVDVYTNEAAFLAHFETSRSNGTFDRFMTVAELARIDVLGEVAGEARQVLEEFGANFLDQVASI